MKIATIQRRHGLAVKIRLRRVGAKKRPFYRLVVADARSPRDGRFIEAVGTYDPLQDPALVKIDAERVLEWISKGAKPTDIARQLLIAEGPAGAHRRGVSEVWRTARRS